MSPAPVNDPSSRIAAQRRMVIPRLPAFGWATFGGARATTVPCLLDREGLQLTTSGRAAILLAMEMLGVGDGDRVLLPTYHCPTMVAPAVALGATPVFYPIDADGMPDMAWLRSTDLGRPRVLLAAHFFGQPRPMGVLRRWCDEQGIALIEDCAHSLFGAVGDVAVGATGDIAIGSLTKFHPVPEGGCLIVNRPVFRTAAALRPASFGVRAKAALDILEIGASFRRLPGLNTPLSATFGAVRALRRLARRRAAAPVAADAPLPPRDGFSIDHALAHRALAAPCAWVALRSPRDRIVRRRQAHYERLAAGLTGLSGVRPLVAALPLQSAPYVFPLWVAHPDPGYAELRRRGIPVSRWDQLWDDVPTLPDDSGFDWSHHVLQLACHQDLSNDDIDAIVAAVHDLYVRRADALPVAVSSLEQPLAATRPRPP